MKKPRTENPFAREDGVEEVVEATIMAENEKTVRDDFWSKMTAVAARIPFAEDVVSCYYCALDPQTPMRAKGILLAALAYFILPFDAVPDFIIGLGFGDDAAVLATAIAVIRSNLKPEHREQARAKLDEIRADAGEFTEAAESAKPIN